jgi:glutamyl-tRNA(Gln) amidotransferase subunit E
LTEGSAALDYKSIQLKVGLEVHQQLATDTKLFCGCPPFIGDESQNVAEGGFFFRRILRPASSELGEIDEAAEFESRRTIRVRYLASHTASCLVEADEEPPHPISTEALETGLLFALSLRSRIADEIHVMRKIVVDGSNTSGFQRTAVISLGGELAYGAKKVRVQTIGLEEDAGRAIKIGEELAGERTYALDRLGTPLVEVALAPIEGTPEEIEYAARTLGRLMRSTGRVAKGLGTIRQDLNISVMNGKVIEVKGVQRLDQIRKVVLFEAARQKFFYDLANDIKMKLGNKLTIENSDVTSTFQETKSNILKKALNEKDGKVLCLRIRGFAGYLGRENEFHSRLGKELGAIAKTYGLGGIFHSDELPSYGITVEEVAAVRAVSQMEPNDAFVLIAGSRDIVAKGSDAIRKRVESASLGVPAETRAASLEGETTFLRPRPGAARMYPETDIPLIKVSSEKLERLRREIPKPWDEQVSTFSKKYDLPHQLAEPMFDSDRRDLFENVVLGTKLAPRYVASTLIDTMLALSRDGAPVEKLEDDLLMKLFEALSQNKFAKEAFPRVLRQAAAEPTLSLDALLTKVGLTVMSEEELVQVVDQVIQQNLDLLKSKGIGVQNILMGRVMQIVRGKADGKLVNDTLARQLSEALKREKVNQ